MVQAPVRVRSVEETVDDGFVADHREAVIEHLRANDDLLPVLARIRARVNPPLQAKAPIRLHLSFDPEWEDDPPRLFARIPTTLDADPAVDLLDEARRAWWNAESRRLDGRLILSLDFV